jgi:hypothetical protein
MRELVKFILIVIAVATYIAVTILFEWKYGSNDASEYDGEGYD